jgi:hypothetical protein
MTTKPNDTTRLDFITTFGLRLERDMALGVWKLCIGDRTAMGKTPRKAIDQALRFTKAGGAND